MGQPEDYLDEEALNEEQPNFNSQTTTSINKKLYGDINDRYISGVCSGIGHYVGLDSFGTTDIHFTIVCISRNYCTDIHYFMGPSSRSCNHCR